MRDIARAVGITQGAIYRHYPGKEDLLAAICRTMEENDRQNALDHGVPGGDALSDAGSYGSLAFDAFREYALSMLSYWAADPCAAPFRRMLTVEQYRTPQMADLFAQYLGKGPLAYVEDCIGALIRNGEWRQGDAACDALQVWGAFGVLLQGCDREGADIQAAQRHMTAILDSYKQS